MLHLIVGLIPKPLHRLLLRTAHRVRVVWWRVAPREPDDCRVIALDPERRVLLVRHSYGSGQWMLPGGGSSRGEHPVATATRELWEETGCRLDTPAELPSGMDNARKRRFVVAGRASGTLRIDGREIVEARFFALDALPVRTSSLLGPRLARWVASYEAGRPLPGTR
jgi:8-oxo-dGTP pyrophosphatase MutT (NUDIX family)